MVVLLTVASCLIGVPMDPLLIGALPGTANIPASGDFVVCIDSGVLLRSQILAFRRLRPPPPRLLGSHRAPNTMARPLAQSVKERISACGTGGVANVDK